MFVTMSMIETLVKIIHRLNAIIINFFLQQNIKVEFEFLVSVYHTLIISSAFHARVKCYYEHLQVMCYYEHQCGFEPTTFKAVNLIFEMIKTLSWTDW